MSKAPEIHAQDGARQAMQRQVEMSGRLADLFIMHRLEALFQGDEYLIPDEVQGDPDTLELLRAAYLEGLRDMPLTIVCDGAGHAYAMGKRDCYMTLGEVLV